MAGDGLCSIIRFALVCHEDYAATSLDGYIATEDDSLDWLFPLGDIAGQFHETRSSQGHEPTLAVAVRSENRTKLCRVALPIAQPPPRSDPALGIMANALRRTSVKALAGVLLAPASASAQPKGEDPMPFIAKGTFTVEMKPQAEPGTVDGVSLGRVSLDKRFEGDLFATGKGEMLTAFTPIKGSAGYVAIERVTGALQGRRGSFVFKHSGAMDQGEQRLSITVVPDSGTCALAGISGSFKIDLLEGKHFYEFEYSLP